jgi:hypothetical protein
VSEDVLVWNGRAAEPAPSKREAFVGVDEHAGQAELNRAEVVARGRQPVASEDEPPVGGSAGSFERMYACSVTTTSSSPGR